LSYEGYTLKIKQILSYWSINELTNK